MHEERFRFQLDRGQQLSAGTLQYRPYGTRSLKIEVSTAAALPVLYLRPDHAAPRPGPIHGYVDQGQDFIVSWGGGHEGGPPAMVEDFLLALEKPVPLSDGTLNTLYFNVTHVGPELPQSAPLTISAYSQDTTLQASLTITLQKPAGYGADVMRLAPVEGEAGHWAINEGNRLPAYDSRWWPAARITYLPVPPLPLSVRREGARLLVLWKEQETVAEITDLTNPSVLDQVGAVTFELLDFDQQHFVLRPWFFWLDNEIGYNFLIFGRHEAPDAERFDILLRKDNGRAVLACTDLHWRESWGQVIAPPLQATIGLTSQAKWDLGRKALGKILGSAKDARLCYNPLGYIQRLAERLAAGDETVIFRAKGTEAHVPMLNNIQQVKIGEDETLVVTHKGTRTVHEMTSTDVRRG